MPKEALAHLECAGLLVLSEVEGRVLSVVEGTPIRGEADGDVNPKRGNRDRKLDL